MRVSPTVLFYSVLYAANNQVYLATEFVKSLLHLLSNVFKFMFYINKNIDTSFFK